MADPRIATIRAALEALPARCRYHGDETEPSGRDRLYGREACCDTGVPTQRRKKAEQALNALTPNPRASEGGPVRIMTVDGPLAGGC